MFVPSLLTLAFGVLAVQPGAAHVSHPPRGQEGTCKKTTVAILGGGMAGISAAETLSKHNVDDFLILEYRDRIGGRAWHENFGKNKDGKPYVVEMGANWVQGLGSLETHENPIWTLAKEFNLSTTYSNYSNVSTYNEHGFKDYSHLQDEYDAASEIASQRAGTMLKDNLQDQSAKAGLALAGWRPKSNDMEAQAIDWWSWDFEGAYSPLESSLVFGFAGDNLTSNGFSDEDNFVTDQRGFNHIVKGMSSRFLRPNDTRLHLNTQITNITYSKDGVVISNRDGSCVEAAYAICTFSLGVLQNDAVAFHPELPEWKQTAIQMFTMGTYTKIFMQFNETFWPTDTQYFLYADPHTRGWYPIFQSLSTPGFHPGSNIIFVTVTSEFAYRAERQSDEQTKSEIMDVLRKMFPEKNVPEPTAFMYPRWSTEPWAFGSYSNWPAGTTLEMHQNLRANADRLWFAGEATSPTYFGFLHGAWFEGQHAGREISRLLRGCKRNELKCGPRTHYDELHGTTPLADYTVVNGWDGNSFVDNNED
ncbi:putative flavin containing polyamine oxidase [Aspergillus affinis]|uniref:putative flavin containing polyamine oxidase n=1 Tax=Aspergillus affinis TaxID=1070780 RepID=UPI0022FF0D0F|nr:amine oxidase [Aspergillus affinis]KAI9038274.1 amine oxidase [Aspergillus affinis]